MRLAPAALVCLFSFPLLAVPTLVNSAQTVTTTGEFSAAVNYTATSGNLLIVFCAAAHVATTQIGNLAITDGVNSYVVDQFITDTTQSDGKSFSLSHAINATGGALTLTCIASHMTNGRVFPTKGFVLSVFEYSGFGTAYIGDGSNPFTLIGSGTGLSAGLLQITNPNALLVAPFVTDSTSATCITSAGSGWTMGQNNSNAASTMCAGVMTQVGGAGNYTATGTVASANWVMGIMAYVPVSSSPYTIGLTEIVAVPSTSNNRGIWGTSINNSNGTTSTLVSYGGKQYVAWYDGPLEIFFAVIDADGTVTRYGTGLFGPGGDNHMSISFEIDSGGYIHLTFGMHTTPLIYYKSTTPLVLTAWTGPLSMLGTNESSITFGTFFRHPTSGEVYYTFQKGGGARADQYFYHYNTSTSSWEAAAGTGTAGAVTNLGVGVPFLNGPPQLAPNGVYWFNWIYAYPDGVVCCGPDEYLLGWNGTSFIKPDGSPQTMPVTLGNLSPAFSVAVGNQPKLQVLGSFSIDSSGTFFIPYTNLDGGGIAQQYVAENHTGTFVIHQLTSNDITWHAPNPIRWAGLAQSTGVVSLGACTYVIYADIYRQRSGMVAASSCDNFTSTQNLYIGSVFNPNWVFFPDRTRLHSSGRVSFFFQNTNDSQLMFTYVDNYSVDAGKVSVFTWDAIGGTGRRGKSTTRGSAVAR